MATRIARVDFLVGTWLFDSLAEPEVRTVVTVVAAGAGMAFVR